MLDAVSHLDVRTLMVVLLWGNMLSAVLFLAYYGTVSRRSRAGVIYLPAKGVQSLAYLLLLSRDQLPDSISVILGNCFLMIGFYLEALTMLSVIEELRPNFLPLTIILAMCIAGFVASEHIYPNSSLRVAVASICMFMILIFPNLRMMVSRNTTKFKRLVGVFYTLLLAVLLPRAFVAITGGLSILTNSRIQTITFMSMVLILIFGLPAYLLLIKEQADQMLCVMATTDYLTGLPNRYVFLEAAERVFERSRIARQNVAVIFFDVDYFKTINDTHGHAFGDTVLTQLGRVIRESIRPSDLSSRYGGEEFVLLLPDAGSDSAGKVAQRLRDAIAHTIFPGHADFSLTISVGIKEGVPEKGDTLELYISQADTAMYSAKRSGRDQVVEFDPLLTYACDIT
ncbi:MAG: GGDEF domain-containing protein [Planctomycetaceae bacterium]|nr:GGDEF domain-containing protein [Planctomycetaceae bacterium]